MTVLVILFLGTASLLWISIFGYLLVLGSIALRRRQVELGASACPDIAIVIPTLNEEDLILPKLADLRRTDYPSDRMTVVVVDGGSVDQTTKLVRQEIARGEPFHLVSLNGARGRSYQINHALGILKQDIVVFTDVDSVLEPSCIRELISMLERDPNTAVAGATVRPDTDLLEERIHWWFQNYLWWLEGEVLSTAGCRGCATPSGERRCYPSNRMSLLTTSTWRSAPALVGFVFASVARRRRRKSASPSR